MTATHYRGSDGEIKVDGSIVTVVNWEVTIDTSVIASPRVGKVADKKYAGKQDITGSVEQVLITPVLLAMVIGDSDTQTESTAEDLLNVLDVSANAWSELAFDASPTNPTSVKCTLTVGDGNATAGSIIIRGTNSSDDMVTEVLDFAAMTDGDPAQVIYGSQQFKTTGYVDVSANLQPSTGPVYNSLKIEGITGVKTMTPGNATLFDIIGKVEDADGNYVQLTCNNCFFTSGNFPIGDSNTLVACSLPFVIQDADVDVSLSWTST